MLYTATSKARVIALAGLAAVTGGRGAALWHTDLLVARGFGKALEGAKPTLSFQPATKKGTPVQTVAGDEGYWLTRAEVESPTPFAEPSRSATASPSRVVTGARNSWKSSI